MKHTGVKLFIGAKDPCMFCLEICTPEGRGGEKGGSANFKTQYPEPLIQKKYLEPCNSLFLPQAFKMGQRGGRE